MFEEPETRFAISSIFSPAVNSISVHWLNKLTNHSIFNQDDHVLAENMLNEYC